MTGTEFLQRGRVKYFYLISLLYGRMREHLSYNDVQSKGGVTNRRIPGPVGGYIRAHDAQAFVLAGQ